MCVEAKMTSLSPGIKCAHVVAPAALAVAVLEHRGEERRAREPVAAQRRAQLVEHEMLPERAVILVADLLPPAHECAWQFTGSKVIDAFTHARAGRVFWC